MGIIIYNNVRSDRIPIVGWEGSGDAPTIKLNVESRPSYRMAKRILEFSHVPGRPGDIIDSNDDFANTQRSYTCSFSLPKDVSLETAALSVASWLNSSDGYARLEDSYECEGNISGGLNVHFEKGFYHLAAFENELDIANWFQKAGKFNITFSCQPFRYSFGHEYDINGQVIISGFSGVYNKIIQSPFLFKSNAKIILQKDGNYEQAYIRLNHLIISVTDLLENKTALFNIFLPSDYIIGVYDNCIYTIVIDIKNYVAIYRTYDATAHTYLPDQYLNRYMIFDTKINFLSKGSTRIALSAAEYGSEDVRNGCEILFSSEWRTL